MLCIVNYKPSCMQTKYRTQYIKQPSRLCRCLSWKGLKCSREHLWMYQVSLFTSWSCYICYVCYSYSIAFNCYNYYNQFNCCDCYNKLWPIKNVTFKYLPPEKFSLWDITTPETFHHLSFLPWKCWFPEHCDSILL